MPAYNEQDSIMGVINDLRQHHYDYVVINDGSTDCTARILKDGDARYVDLLTNLGIGGAVQTGYLFAKQNGYDIAVQVDGDGQHDVSYIDKLIAPIKEGEAEIVVGSRYVGDESAFKSSFMRRVGIRFLSFVLKVSSGKRIMDVTSGFRAIDSKAINMFVDYYPSDYPEPESLAYAINGGLRVTEVPVAMRERQGGSSSISGLKPVYYMTKVSLATILGGFKGRRSKKR